MAYSVCGHYFSVAILISLLLLLLVFVSLLALLCESSIHLSPLPSSTTDLLLLHYLSSLFLASLTGHSPRLRIPFLLPLQILLRSTRWVDFGCYDTVVSSQTLPAFRFLTHSFGHFFSAIIYLCIYMRGTYSIRIFSRSSGTPHVVYLFFRCPTNASSVSLDVFEWLTNETCY